MDSKSKERRCMMRCGGGAEDKTIKIDRIMLGFRPIAPRPVTTGGNLQVDNNKVCVRSKRKYVRVSKNNNSYRRKNKIIKDMIEMDNNNKVTTATTKTLQLLPERAEEEEETDRMEKDKMVSNSINQDRRVDDDVLSIDQKTVVTWVTVESVTVTDREGLLGDSDSNEGDFEIIKKLGRDTCPGFISDGFNKVQCVNAAYKRMVVVENEGVGDVSTPPPVAVVLEVKEKLPVEVSSFTCKARVQYTSWRNEMVNKMVPCDVWRTGFGGFAWRLDVEAALCLGR